MSKRVWLANGIEGRHVLMGLIAFFGVMLLANGIFVYFAVATFSGGDTSNAYRKGLNYNDTLAAAELQTRLAGAESVLEFYDCGEDPRFSSLAGLPGVTVLYRPPRFGRERTKAAHSGLQCY